MKGGCLCGAVTFTVDGDFERMGHCHCSLCRKSSGTNFGTTGRVKSTAVTWLKGEERIVAYESSPGFQRCFCDTCGTNLFDRATDQEEIYLSMGTVEEPVAGKPSRHIFVADKAPWYTIGDDLPQHNYYPGDNSGPVVDRPAPVAEKRDIVNGSCTCGAVAFEFHGDPLRMYNCHCNRCRKARGTAHAPNVFVPREALRWLRGEDRIKFYKVPEAERFTQAFCSTCGGIVPRVNPDFPFVVVPVGSLDGDPGMRPMAHIFVDYKSSWFEIADDTPQHQEAPPP